MSDQRTGGHKLTMKLASKMGIPVREKNMTLYDVIHADEAFYTSTPASIYPCTKINGLAIGSSQMGTMTQQLIEAWSEDVGGDIMAQTRRYASRTKANAKAGATPYRFNKGK